MELELAQLQGEAHIRELEELVQLLLERSMYEDYYAEGLERISRHQGRVAEKGQLAVLVDGMKAECMARAEVVKAFSVAISTDLVKPLQKLLLQQRAVAKDLRTTVQIEQKQLKAYKTDLEVAQNSYKEQFRKAEEIIVRAEQSQQQAKKQVIQAMNGALKEALGQYKTALEAYNQYIPMHQEKVGKTLGRHTEGEMCRVHEMGETLKKLHAMLLESEEKLRKVTNEQSVLYSKCEDLRDVGVFATGFRQIMTPCVFEPYVGTHPAFVNLEDRVPVISGANFAFEPPAEVKGKMEKLVTQAWSDILGSQQLLVFRDMVREQWGRKVWISCLNVRRAQGLFRLNYGGFCSIAELMNVVLDECEAANDIATAKSCIILSQTFFNMPKAEKQFLQAKITTHTLWRRPETWDSIVQDGIDQELAKQRACGCTDLSTDHKSTVFGQLSSYAHVMSLFEVDASVAESVLEKFCASYSFTKEEIGLLLEISSACLTSQRSLSLDLTSPKVSASPRRESYAEDSPN